MLMQLHEVLQQAHEAALYGVVTLIVVSAIVRIATEEVRETLRKKK